MIFKEGLIVSSQALEGNPLKKPEYLAVMAQAAELGGAVAIRANGYDNILEMKKRVTVPIIGLNKITDEGGMVVITPSFAAAKEIAEAGADMIAVDVTARKSPIKEDTATLVRRIKEELHLPVLADASCFEDALFAVEIGADAISTTLAGYTASAPYPPEEKYVPDFSLLERILDANLGVPVIAEGRFWRPEDVERALRSGAYGVVIGKAITNPLAITTYFCAAANEGLKRRETFVGTEDRNPYTEDIDELSTYRILEKINREDRTVAPRVAETLPALTKLCDRAVDKMKEGGRIVYCGAGTSARLAIIDAAECPPTYGVEYGRVTAIMAGGNNAVFRAAENMEDGFEAGVSAAKESGVCQKDCVIALSANGHANFCLGVLAYAKEVGAETGAIVCNQNTAMEKAAEYTVIVETGAEAIKGSTRMKAGTAQKYILNALSTAVFVRLGCVKSNLMVNIRPSNKKLAARAVTTVGILTGADEESCTRALEECGWDIRKASERLKK